MKRNIYATIIFILASVMGQAQDLAPVKPKGYNLSTKFSYIRTWDAKAPVRDAGEIMNKGVKEVKQTTEYFDGLGRPLQTVIKQGSLITDGQPVDLVNAFEYDEFGREVRKYLPYASGQNNGTLKLDPFDEQVYFYMNPNGVLKGQGEMFFYNKTDYEASSLDRVTKSYSPGNSWVRDGRAVGLKYWSNTANDDVKVWKVDESADGGLGSYQVVGLYPNGELYKNVTVDEEGKQVIEFKDKDGDLILRKVQSGGNADNGDGVGYPGWLCTYYIYDDFKHVRAIIQPAGVDLLGQNGWNVTSAILQEQCFRYEYDHRNRMIMKKVPGSGVMQMVYDARDRLVMTQDAIMALPTKQQWLVTQYDNHDRPVATYKITDPAKYNDASYHREEAKVRVAYPDVTAYIHELLTETHYDNYDGIPTGLTAALNNSGYSNYLNASAGEYPDPIVTGGPVTGLVTWTRVKVLEESTYITSCNIYDEKKRVIQVQTINYTGAADIITNQYSFSGQLLRSHIKHQKGGAKSGSYEVATKNNYDDLGRLISVEKNLNNSGWKLISQMTYDALGQLKNKTLAPGYNNTPGLESLTYDYNIRGWVLGVNREYAKSPSGTEHFFGFDLGFDKKTLGTLGSYHDARYNGNISGTVWKSKGDGQIRKYDFTYDPVNRITGADFNQYNSGFNKTAGIDFSASNISYDANGNLLTMDQTGFKTTGSSSIDRLRYKYESSSNKLKNVIDLDNVPESKLGDFNTSGSHPQKAVKDAYVATPSSVDPYTILDYMYDLNGNMVLDHNKGISSITYNHLNLPQSITVQNKGSIDYVYSASGDKLKKVIHETGKPDKTTLYLFGTYEDDVLQFMPMEEGRIRPVRDGSGALTSFTYDYLLKDQLGNVRMVLTEEQKTNVYHASIEDAARNFEVSLFGEKVNTCAFDKPRMPEPGFDADGSNKKVIRLSGSTADARVGPGVILKVMAGDRIKASAYSWYKTEGMDHTTDPGLISILTNLLGQLSPGISGMAHGTMTGQVTDGVLQPGMESFLGTQAPVPNAPKAYLNWVLLDEEQFKKVDGSCGIVPVPQISPGQGKQLLQANNGSEIEMIKNGYLYVYVSNESKGDVYFDDFHVEHIRGSLIEETHYYPFGLTMAGISSKAFTAGYPENKKKYNGIEKEDGLGIEIYDAQLRELDPQIGRWWQIDPVTDGYENMSPYASMYDNPIKISDPLGNEGDECCWGQIKAVGHFVGGAVVGAVVGTVDNVTGTNFRGKMSSAFEGTGAAAHGWNFGLGASDAAGVVIGAIETAAGGAGMLGGTLATAGTGGAGAPVTVPVTLASAAVAAHGVLTMTNSANNLINQNGRVNAGETTYQTYTKPSKDGGNPYSGRTSGKGTPEQNIRKRDANHHMNETHGPAVLDKSSKNKDAIRGREHKLIKANGGAKRSGGNSGNEINGISDKNKNKKKYLDAADKEGF
ncbi:DUF6443 domain-containing protein [Niastella sp. OAS944]|uniref:DUF6443 domain-containing protein n=1 Tax=Niastella sp. OAS944 TaxID=2664089 RepID=UPI0034922484|nr:RHS repeat-associated protein [Chitinophagaceae bacterium OAS944]